MLTKMAFRNSEGKLVVLSTQTDECIWSGHWMNGVEQNRFSEVYVHITKNSKQPVFYEVYVTFWQGESNSIQCIEDPQEWLEANYTRLSNKEIARLGELRFKFEETA